MDIEKIKSELVSQIGQTSLSDRTLSDYVSSVAPKDGSDPDEAFFATHVAILKSLSGQLSHDITTQVNDFKKNYKPAQDPQPPTPPTPPTPPAPAPGSGDNEQLNALMARIKALEESNNGGGQNMTKLEQQLQELLKLQERRSMDEYTTALVSSLDGRIEANKLVINDKPTWDLAVDMVKGSIKSDTTGDQLLEMVKGKYDELFKRLNPSGGRVAFGSSHGGGQESFVQSFLKKKAEDEKLALEAREKFAKSLK